jgi:hypothetical protein
MKFALVRREPSEAMRAAGGLVFDGVDPFPREVFERMLSASEEPTGAKQDPGGVG